MKTQGIFRAFVVVALVSISGFSFAADHGMQQTSNASHGAQGERMQGPMMGQASKMGGMKGMMTGDQPGMGGMAPVAGMMSGCPMMGSVAAVLSPQQQLQMHAEMMQAMGKIMEKYAAQADSAN